jgi:hypothetical protein
VHHSVISVQTILLIQMFSVSLKLFILASAAADADADGAAGLALDKDANSTKLASTQGPGVERESAPAARPVAEETLDSRSKEGHGDKPAMHDASGGDDTPKKIEDGFPQVSWLEASATAEQAATTAAAHRGYMVAGVERMYRNLEAVEHAQNAIERLPSIHHQVELMSNLMDSVNDLEAAFGDLHSQGITRGVINSAAKFVDARELEAASDGQVKDPSRMPASSTDGADEGISTGMQTSLLESGATVEQGLSAGVPKRRRRSAPGDDDGRRGSLGQEHRKRRADQGRNHVAREGGRPGLLDRAAVGRRRVSEGGLQGTRSERDEIQPIAC